MKYLSKPHQVDGWQFDPLSAQYRPSWVIEAEQTGKVFITIDKNKDSYATIVQGKATLKAVTGDWLLLHDSGEISVCPGESFENRYGLAV